MFCQPVRRTQHAFLSTRAGPRFCKSRRNTSRGSTPADISAGIAPRNHVGAPILGSWPRGLTDCSPFRPFPFLPLPSQDIKVQSASYLIDCQPLRPSTQLCGGNAPLHRHYAAIRARTCALSCISATPYQHRTMWGILTAHRARQERSTSLCRVGPGHYYAPPKGRPTNRLLCTTAVPTVTELLFLGEQSLAWKCTIMRQLKSTGQPECTKTLQGLAQAAVRPRYD